MLNVTFYCHAKCRGAFLGDDCAKYLFIITVNKLNEVTIWDLSNPYDACKKFGEYPNYP